ncbi:hypothetical protein [Thalassotalea marina]|uniref:Uncharacterized protein n=1 Tax=Thalassotalea marina TaxID=1673741 RepID=A0A919EIB1_9GAMM|nr:hypothetical protein [Thalassotalea marina]GHF82256.1 hypothetical protein GCM10017161_06790 [Thalassotalea marina]
MVKQAGMLAICLFVHVFVLNFVVVNGGSFYFYVEENTTVKAILTYLAIAVSASLMFVVNIRIREALKRKSYFLSDRVWFFMAIAMMAALGVLLLP